MLVFVAGGLLLTDLITTLIAIKLSGSDVESNPIHSMIIAKYGIVGFGLSYALIGGLLLFFFARNDQLLVGFIASLILVSINNAYALLRLFHS